MKKKKKNDWPVIAICYDFDKTLSPKDMQEYSLLPKLNCSAAEFWGKSNSFAKTNGMDKILSYMKLVVDEATKTGARITEKDFNNMGKDVDLFNGVETWFDRINKFGEDNEVNIEHYIISAGIKEIIQGTKIKKYFKEIYASSFVFDEYGKPVWPKQVVNYTTKTQYLFRINKDCTDLNDEESVNKYLEDNERRIPFGNFIYIGDSETDIPAMKIIKRGGGHSIGVYKPCNRDFEKISDLLVQDRINYFAPTNYEENSKIEILVKNIIKEIKEKEKLTSLNSEQKLIKRILNHIKGFSTYIKDQSTDVNFDLRENKKYSKIFFKKYKTIFKKDFGEQLSDELIDDIFISQEEHLKEFFKDVETKQKDEIKNKESETETE